MTNKTAGVLLKEARIQKHITLEDVEVHTKIRKKFLEAIENDTYALLPSMSYAKGFVKNYAEYLGMNSEVVMAFFRRQNAEISRSSLLPKGVDEPLNRPFFRLTPTRFTLGIILFFILIFLGYFGIQVSTIQKAPKLVLTEPVDNSKTLEKRLNVMGETDMDATITLNGISVLVRSDGKFFDSVTLTPGVNTITIVATSKFGKTETVLKRVQLE
jgi:cytoskeletal protein RodZ